MTGHEWRDRAACLGKDTEMFFSNEREDVRAAIKICDACPVIKECRDYARRLKVKEGVWAGTERNRQYD